MRSATRRSLSEVIPGLTMGPDPESDCAHCPHNWGDHLLVSERQPPLAGWTECPVDECECHSTWDVPAALKQIREQN